ncbi:MAG: EscU/YscU/HrcU family type III secretion system export apparatus switch protein [Herbinix sp.]|nr:EscU/YscU/HrcU family type III secretion system export apparatus switch protein [Herbinix sp.]
MFINIRNKVDNIDEKNKKKTAVALSYDPEDTAPKIIATGKGILADKIIGKAKEADIPIHKDEALADTLSRLELGSNIPPELYEVVAEVLVFVDKMDRIKGKLNQ